MVCSLSLRYRRTTLPALLALLAAGAGWSANLRALLALYAADPRNDPALAVAPPARVVATTVYGARPWPPPNATAPFFSPYDRAVADGCLPAPDCLRCLRHRRRPCQDAACRDACGCYCATVCRADAGRRAAGRTVRISPPPPPARGGRLIPRLVHQTYYEAVTPESHPLLARLAETWRASGWEYRFWDDAAAVAFLEEHFPPEVAEAHASLVHGAFRADLFRYCVLLIQGGIYADVDVRLESRLDSVIDADVGFMVPIDNAPCCLWNGLLAAAPGHPFLAAAVARAVNAVRNRFATPDLDRALCPKPDLYLAHRQKTLYLTGPCALGAAVNAALGRHPQAALHVGEWDAAGAAGGQNRSGGVVPPGRTVLLVTNMNMGPHGGFNHTERNPHGFTHAGKDVLMAATNMVWAQTPPGDEVAAAAGDSTGSNDVEEAAGGGAGRGKAGKTGKAGKEAGKMVDSGGTERRPHYSELQRKATIYGLEGVYTDDVRADEDMEFVVLSAGTRLN